MPGLIAGFDWDEGNREKCAKHGVSVEEVEAVALGSVRVYGDDRHSLTEARFNAIGKTLSGRHVFLVFTIRQKKGKNYIRPISARYMHRKEVKYYEEKTEEASEL